MRLFISFALLCVSTTAFADDAAEQKRTTLLFLTSLQKPTGGFEGGPKDTKATLRSTSAAVRALKYLTGKKTAEAIPNVKETTAFVLSCYDPKTGGFADVPGGKPDVYLTAVGVMAAMELEIPKEKFAKAMSYLDANATTFEDVRIGAAAVEAWGVKDCPFVLDGWLKICKDAAMTALTINEKDGGAREVGSVVAMLLRLQAPGFGNQERALIVSFLHNGQRDDGAFGKKGEKASDMETTYRVMRAFHLLQDKPDDIAKLREFIAKCRNKDGGYGVKPGDPSTPGGVYFATIITKWLDEMEKK